METPTPDPSTRWREISFAALDFETTGLVPRATRSSRSRRFPIEDGRIRLATAATGSCARDGCPDAESIRIHGLRPADLEDAPPLDEVLDELLAAITGRVVIAHVAAVERGFLSRRWTGTGSSSGTRSSTRPRSPPSWRRTERFARVVRPGLTELARAFRLPVHRPHHADGDALTTAQVFLALATHLDRVEPLTLGAMLELRPREARSARSAIACGGPGAT